ncbi:carbonic anhydrase [Solicola sp. PLA-1-18]|uniref:carbonic anhydrase n=1 Tax=Solicola sp. PLA-1-18 TaxID=3380532 RepID=UPI003B7A3F67
MRTPGHLTTAAAGPSRRSLLGLGAGAGLALATGAAAPAVARGTSSLAPAARRAERVLRAGNARFVSGTQRHPHESLEWRRSLTKGQHPIAVVLGCADSRATPELVFDEGLGDLFVVRSAGEVLDDAVIGSIEYAVEHLDVALVVVLGHADCGAVGATVDVVRGDGEATGFVSSLVRSIEPAVLSTPEQDDDVAFRAACVAEQARRTATILQERSIVLREAVDRGARVVGATYALDDGRVSWL